MICGHPGLQCSNPVLLSLPPFRWISLILTLFHQSSKVFNLFEADLCHRFSDRTFSDIVEEFTKLTQKGYVEEYQEKFEELQPHMLLQNPTLTEEFFVSLFISGLREDIKHKVKALDPKNLSEASKQAKLYELSVEFQNRRVRSSFKTPPYPNPLYTSKTNTLIVPTKPTSVPNQKQSLMDYRRINNLCFRCGEKYFPGHQCKTRQLNMITEEMETSTLENDHTATEHFQQQEEENLEIFMNAITGCIGHNTLRIQGTIQGKPLNILIDNGSTHSFLTHKWVDIGIQIKTPYPLAITVANGQQLFSSAHCNKVEWQMQGHTFLHDFRLLKLGGSDMVLGVDWMKLFSPILMDFNNMTLSFDHQGEQICIQGQQPSSELQQISGATLLKMSAWDSDILGHVHVLERYSIVFSEPKGLPPQRSHDHAILLKSNSTTVNLRPYRFPHNQKTKVEYLSHIISAAGVSTDPSKIEVMQSWPRPKTLKSLRGFLGLTGYYRRFIKDYGIISRPLTKMLKKNGFQWNSVAYVAFEDLKKAMCTAPVLALPDFSKTFYLETDASSGGVGAVLSQEGRLIAYLKQKLTTIIQKKGLTKLLGLDYTIQYRRGKSNIVADALSRRWEDQGQCLTMGVTVLIPSWVQEIEDSYKEDSLAQNWISILTINPAADNKWKYTKVVLRYEGRVYVGATGSLRLQIIQNMHDSPQGGHSGAQATYYRIRSNFYWPNLKSMVATYVRCCDICQQTKVEHIAKPGLLQPLPVPTQAWEIITMDFIEGLPTSLKKNCILVIVDKFTKYSHFLSLSHPYTAAEVAKLYLDNIYKLHGQPKMAISDRDKTFTSLFWRELMKQLGTKAVFSTAYHPEIYGQTERVNQCLEQYLRGICLYQPRKWAKWLPQAEWWYNTTHHTALKMTPFQALYGYKPPIMPYRQTSLTLRRNLKLAAKYYGLYKIIEKIGAVAYKLHLPESSRLHPVFHVSLLKKFIEDSSKAVTDPPAIEDDGQLRIKPLKVVGRRIVNRNGKPITQLLIRWENLDEANDTWEDYSVLQGQFSMFDPWGQGSSQAGGIVIAGEDEEERGVRIEGGEEERRNEEDLGLEERGLGIEENNLGIESREGIEARGSNTLDLADVLEKTKGTVEKCERPNLNGPIPANDIEG
ncbi:uncharacterized protein LOC120129711 [Hibiscus syriacus]|uniref:uncharacterized protein LOC120129711 n=1 Tax=Hibiscus syriacus TaxID=106335 RepID=UPI001923A54C|nr:uncharacterized protein LOC120129711 [Hibiscus syriacus]